MKKYTRFVAVLLCAMMVMSFMLSAAFIITYADHNCIGHDCEICHDIQRCQQALKKTSLDAAVWVGLAVIELFYVLLIIDSCDNQTDDTLVSMKIKLSC